MRNVPDKKCKENQTTHILCGKIFFENGTVQNILWKNIVERSRPQMIIWRMRIARWITKTTHTHSKYVIIISFPHQQWLHEGA